MNVRIATIDTMLSFYLAFLYTNRPYYNEDRILCMCEFLFKVQQTNRLEQKGLLKRFSINCYGEQHTLESMREEKSNKFNELKANRGNKEWEEWFLRYVPKHKTRKTRKTPKTRKTWKKSYKKHKKSYKKGKKFGSIKF